MYMKISKVVRDLTPDYLLLKHQFKSILGYHLNLRNPRTLNEKIQWLKLYDRNGGIETSIPTTIDAPTYYVDGVLHYVVDHTPALFYKTFTEDNSAVIWPFINELVSDRFDKTMQDSLIIKDGEIIDQEINKFQNR